MNSCYRLLLALCLVSSTFAATFPNDIANLKFDPSVRNPQTEENLLLTVTTIPNWEKIQANKRHVIYSYTPDRLFMSNLRELLDVPVTQWLKLSDEQRVNSLQVANNTVISLDSELQDTAMRGMLTFTNPQAARSIKAISDLYAVTNQIDISKPQNFFLTAVKQNSNTDLGRYITNISVKYGASFPLAYRIVAGDIQTSLTTTTYTPKYVNGVNKFLFNGVVAPYIVYLNYLDEKENDLVIAQIKLLEVKDKHVNPASVLSQFSAANLLAKYILTNPASTNVADTLGIYPLHYAALLGDPTTIEVLLSKSSLDASDKNKNNVLHYAVLNPNPNVLLKLLAALPKSKRIELATAQNKDGLIPLNMVATTKEAPSTTAASNYNILVDQMILDGIKVDVALKYRTVQFRKVFDASSDSFRTNQGGMQGDTGRPANPNMGPSNNPNMGPPNNPNMNNPGQPMGQTMGSRSQADHNKMLQGINDSQFLGIPPASIPPPMAATLKEQLKRNPDQFSPQLTAKIKQLPNPAPEPTQPSQPKR